MIGYFFGIFYTAGPKPLNATKFCELIVSGMISVFIIEVGVYIAICGQYAFTWNTFLTILLKCLPIFFLFFATQLANNTCDLREDLINGRKTFASYLGTKKSIFYLKTFTFLAFLIQIFFLPLTQFLGFIIQLF